ncbi:hypothetical protein DPMN_174880 [Dreissena polymorpha]|uniref:Uncharacterized protein n=1 Tax=Dreissena polymorpha TaxID=45954 RepID=A0A9D4E671_DREPO|nr:hypothetical protein DPMN_174880 [Dreissena polymorpha]
MKSELYDGDGHGVDGTVTESGWSKSAVFKRYLEVSAQALSPNKVYASFRKTSIYPYNPNAIDSSIFKPSEARQQGTSPVNIQPSEKEVSQLFCNKEANMTSKRQPTKSESTLVQWSVARL